MLITGVMTCVCPVPVEVIEAPGWQKSNAIWMSLEPAPVTEIEAVVLPALLLVAKVGDATVMKDLLPDLDRSTAVPRLMKKIVNSGARGVSNAKGFYRYTPDQAKRWENLFMKFSHEIREIALRYPETIGETAQAGRSSKKVTVRKQAESLVG